MLDCKPLSTLMATNDKLFKYNGKEKEGGWINLLKSDRITNLSH